MDRFNGGQKAVVKGDEAEPNVLNPEPNQCIIYDGTEYSGDYRIIELPEGSSEYLWDPA